MKRRDFLKLSGTAALASAAGMGARFALARSAADYRKTLILIELKGANDGLNTVVPYADPNYYALRPRVAVKRGDVLQLDERCGLHPSLAPLMPLWQARELAIVQGLGYPSPNLSHFRSIEIWDTASKSDEYLHNGWLTRAFASSPAPRSFAADGVIVGSQELGPLAGMGTRAIALANTEQFLRQAKLAAPIGAEASGALAHILKVEADIAQAAAGLNENYRFNSEFPNHAFGNTVKTAAQVMAAKSGVAVIRITHSGYDTHQNQPGAHANLLKQLAEGMSALRAALLELNKWDTTLVMSYSEFGRRAGENGSNGTDHGAASVQLVMGGRVRGGLHGTAPRLDRLENGNLRYVVDFRSYYATALERWWGLPLSTVDSALGGRYPALDLLRG